jgi:hypothetical protein
VKTPGTYRILALGDSFTMGKGVADDKTFSALLERALNAENATGNRKVEVLNGGVDSYAPVLSRIQLTRLAQIVGPDLVIYGFDMSDLLQELAYRRLATVGSDGQIVAVDGVGRKDESELLSGHAISLWIDHHMFGTRLLLYLVKTALRKSGEYTVDDTVQTANPDLLKHTLASDTVDRGGQWKNVFESILGMKRFCDEAGIDYVLMIYPWGHQVSDLEWGPGRTFLVPPGSAYSDKSRDLLTGFAKQHGIDLIDLFPAFRGYEGPERLFFDYDQHWTEAGHGLVSDNLARVIAGRYLNKSP